MFNEVESTETERSFSIYMKIVFHSMSKIMQAIMVLRTITSRGLIRLDNRRMFEIVSPKYRGMKTLNIGNFFNRINLEDTYTLRSFFLLVFSKYNRTRDVPLCCCHVSGEE